MIMQQMPKERRGDGEELAEKRKESPEKNDQKERPYYYDDAHGYEKYEPENDDESDDDV